jgi:hypothetical protein
VEGDTGPIRPVVATPCSASTAIALSLYQLPRATTLQAAARYRYLQQYRVCDRDSRPGAPNMVDTNSLTTQTTGLALLRRIKALHWPDRRLLISNSYHPITTAHHSNTSS